MATPLVPPPSDDAYADAPAISGRDRFAMRYASKLNTEVRHQLENHRSALLTELRELDGDLQVLSSRRRALLRQLGDIRDRLWPRVEWCHGRRPPRDDQPPLPPLNDNTTRLTGRALRSTCLAILRRYERLRLDELHALIHLHGYAIASTNPVKTLADAMAYELRKGRLVRPERGVYQIAGGFRPRPGRHGSSPPGGLNPPSSNPIGSTELPADPVLVQLNRATADGVPETGGLASGHDAVSLSDISGPLELRASLTMYCAASRASPVRERLSRMFDVPRSVATSATWRVLGVKASAASRWTSDMGERFSVPRPTRVLVVTLAAARPPRPRTSLHAGWRLAYGRLRRSPRTPGTLLKFVHPDARS